MWRAIGAPIHVPGPNDDVVIAVSGATPTVAISSNVESVHSITSSDPLVISGGGLTVTANSTISGGLAMTGGTLTATGPGVALNVTGTTTISGANVFAENGATLNLTALTSYSNAAGLTTLEATGTNSVLNLANLATVTESSNSYQAQPQFEALAGGTVTLSGLTTINTGTVVLEADGSASVLNVPALTTFTEANGWTYSTLQASNSGTVNDGNLATLSNVNLTVAGPGENLTLGSVTSFNSGNIAVSGGASLSLPGVTGYTGTTGATTLEATGTGSVLTLAHLTSVTQPTNNYQAQTSFEALAGGTVTLSGLTTINTGTVVLEADGTASVLNVPVLMMFTEANGWTYSTLQASNSGTVNDGNLATLSNLNLTVAGPGENLTLGSVTSFNSGNIAVSGGASLSLPGVTSYTGNTGATTLEATGTGSVLTLAHLTSVTQTANNYPAQTNFEALAGGTVTLSGLTTINTGTVVLEADGTASVLNVPALTTFTEANGWTYSTLQASNSGTVNDGNLATLSNVNLTVAGPGENLTLGSVTSFNSGNIAVSGGASLSLPGVTSYTGNTGATTLEATGTGSVLTLAHLTSVTQTANNYQAQTNFEALAGGTVTLSGLTTINTGTVVLESDGTGSVFNVGVLTGFTEANGWTYSLLQASNGGTMHDSGLTSLSNVNLTLDGSTAISTSQLTSYAGGTITVNGGSPSFSGLTTFNGSSITVSGGGTVSLPGVTSDTGISGTTTLEATGTGSTLTLAHLTGVTQPTNNYQGPNQLRGIGRRRGDADCASYGQHRHGGVGGRRQR